MSTVRKVLDERLQARRDVFNRYLEALGDIEGVHFMPEFEGTYSNLWLTALALDSEVIGITPYELIDALEAENEACPYGSRCNLTSPETTGESHGLYFNNRNEQLIIRIS